MYRWTFLVLVMLLSLLNFSCSGEVQKKDQPAAPVKVRSVLILNYPSSVISPGFYNDLLSSLAIELHRKYGVHVTSGLPVGRGIWGSLDHARKRTCDVFKNRIDEAHQAFEGLRIGKAIELCEKALTVWDMCCVEQSSQDSIRDLFMVYGLALLSRERKEEAMAAFRQLAALAPMNQPDEDGLSQDQANAISLAYKQELSGNPTQVKILTEPQGANITIDGKSVGQTPLETVNLFPGRHCVRLNKDGFGTWSKSLPEGVPPTMIQAWLPPSWRGAPPEELWEMIRDLSSPGQDETQQLAKAAAISHTDAVILLKLEPADGKLAMNTMLFIPKVGVANPWEKFDLGTGSNKKALHKRLAKIAATYTALKWKDKGKKPKKSIKTKTRKKKRKKAKKKKHTRKKSQ